jgi:hypothetical protein
VRSEQQAQIGKRPHDFNISGDAEGQILWHCAKEFAQIPPTKELKFFSRAIRSCQESVEKKGLAPMQAGRSPSKPVGEYMAIARDTNGKESNRRQEELQKQFHVAAQGSVYFLVGICYLSAFSNFSYIA